MPPKSLKVKDGAGTTTTGTKKAAATGAKKKAPKKGAYQMPEHLPSGSVLTDLSKSQWKIGLSIGAGGFGEIYSAFKSGESGSQKTDDHPYVVKLEPHSNGPLFVEMHFYMRNAKLTDIEVFRKAKGLKTLGMPHFVSHGSHELNDIKHRFLVMPRYGKDIWKIYKENDSQLPEHTIYRLAMQMLDVLEYVHKCKYVHGDLKGANMLLGTGKGGAAQAYLVDFGLACHYTTAPTFKPDPKKMHNGTIEYTSRDAHRGVPTMRGDLEILAYNLVNWSGVSLPWETDKLLAQPLKVQAAKETFMQDTEGSLKKLFKCPDAIQSFFKYITRLEFNDQPDYAKCQKFFEAGLKSLNKSNSGDLEFKIVAASASKKSPVKRVTTKVTPIKASPIKKASKRHIVVDEESDDEHIATVSSNDSNDEYKSGTTPKKVKRDKPKADTATPLTSVGTPNRKKTHKDKVYEVNMLDISFDADVVINIRRLGDKNARKYVVQKAGVSTNNVTITKEKKDKKKTKREIDVDLNQSSNSNVINVKARKVAASPKSSARKSPRSS